MKKEVMEKLWITFLEKGYLLKNLPEMNVKFLCKQAERVKQSAWPKSKFYIRKKTRLSQTKV